MFTLVLLAGGLGTRLGPLTRDIPKSLIKICGKPFIYWQLNLLKMSGVKKIVLCTSYHSNLIEEYVGDGERFEVEVIYSKDGTEQLGTGGAILNALNHLDDEFMVMYGDSYLPINYESVCKAFKGFKKPAMMVTYLNNDRFDVSNIDFAGNLILEYSRSRKLGMHRYIDFGLSVMKKTIFENSSFGKKFDLGDIFIQLSQNRQLAGLEVVERFFEIGSLAGIRDLTFHIQRRKNGI